MTEQKQRLITQFVAGIFGSTILGIFGWLTMMTYGGNYGCWPIIDKIFNDVGYLSCGSFGSYAGSYLGAIIAIIFIKIKKIGNFRTSLYLLVGAFLLPIIYACWAFGRFGDYPAVFAGIQITVIAILVSAIPSTVITFLVNIPQFFKRT